MKLFMMALTVLVMSAFVLAEEKEECVVFNGQEFCESVTVITIGSTQIPVSDPLALLNATKKSNVKKLSLWEVYDYPEVVKELSSQLGMTPSELIFTLREADKNWAALYDLASVYEEVSPKLLKQIGQSTVDELFRKIINEINNDIKSQLAGFDGLQFS